MQFGEDIDMRWWSVLGAELRSRLSHSAYTCTEGVRNECRNKLQSRLDSRLLTSLQENIEEELKRCVTN